MATTTLSTSSNLFPVPPAHIISGFTTCPSIQIPNVAHVALQDSVLGVHKVSAHTTHKVVTDIPNNDPQTHPNAWEAIFPQGSINPGNKTSPPGGFGFYMRGPSDFSTILKTERPAEVFMSYEVMFEEGWQWQKGGKLPGICKKEAHPSSSSVSPHCAGTQQTAGQETLRTDVQADVKRIDAGVLTCG